jgi:hypothetical protein
LYDWLKNRNLKIFIPLLLSALVAILYFTLVQNVFDINIIESKEINTSNFSLQYISKLLVVFIKALFHFNWFSISSILFIISVIYFIYFWKSNNIIIAIIVLYLSFLFVYCFHYRSYDFIYFGYVQPFVVLRYLNNIYIISAIISSIFVIKFMDNTTFRIITFIVLSGLIVFSFISTLTLRQEYSKLEIAERFTKPEKILDYLKGKDNCILISNNIIIFQLLGPDSLEICDINSIDKYYSNIRNEEKYLYLTSSFYSKNYRYRYQKVVNNIKSIKLEKVLAIDDEHILYRITP